MECWRVSLERGKTDSRWKGWGIECLLENLVHGIDWSSGGNGADQLERGEGGASGVQDGALIRLIYVFKIPGGAVACIQLHHSVMQTETEGHLRVQVYFTGGKDYSFVAVCLLPSKGTFVVYCLRKVCHILAQ